MTKVLTRADSQARKVFKKLQNRYGLRYGAAMAAVACLSMFSPLPGTLVLAVAIVSVVAEVHRAISPRGSFHQTTEGERIMSINCDIFIKWNATPVQLRALGTALWRWWNRTASNTSIYQCVDSQALADLIAGKFPVPRQMAWHVERGYHLSIGDEVSLDRLATIDRLRQELPVQGIEDILVDGASWNLIDGYTTPGRINHGKAISNTDPNGAMQACESQTGPMSCL